MLLVIYAPKINNEIQGMSKTDKEVRTLIMLHNNQHKSGKTLQQIAIKANMCAKTARKYVKTGKLPSEIKKPRTHRTRKDVFEQNLNEIENLLHESPELQAKTILTYLIDKYPDVYNESHTRSMQRKVKDLRYKLNANTKEVIFRQDIQPGKQSQSDWFWSNELNITIKGQSYKHLIFHFMLPYSKWEDIMFCESESFESLSKGYAQAVNKLGGTLPEHRTDNLSAATKKEGSSRVFTDRWMQFMNHYGVTPSRNNPGVSHENGSVEKSHDLLRSAINQHLLLRKSRDFTSEEEYQEFVLKIVKKRNETRQEKLGEELKSLQALPNRGWNDPKILNVRVSPSSTINVEGCAYSVQSQLISYHLKAYVYSEYIELFFNLEKIATIAKTKEKHKIDYRHIIDSLVKKPNAFANYQYKNDLFPSLIFRKTYDSLKDTNPNEADKNYLKILQLAKCYGEQKIIEAIKECQQAGFTLIAKNVSEFLKPEQIVVPETFVLAPNLNDYNQLLSSALETNTCTKL